MPSTPVRYYTNRKAILWATDGVNKLHLYEKMPPADVTPTQFHGHSMYSVGSIAVVGFPNCCGAGIVHSFGGGTSQKNLRTLLQIAEEEWFGQIDKRTILFAITASNQKNAIGALEERGWKPIHEPILNLNYKENEEWTHKLVTWMKQLTW